MHSIQMDDPTIWNLNDHFKTEEKKKYEKEDGIVRKCSLCCSLMKIAKQIIHILRGLFWFRLES